MARIREYAKKEVAAKANPKKGRNAFRPKYLVLDPTTPAKKGVAFWTGRYVIDNIRGEALGMHLKTVEGKKFLLVEVGNFLDPPVPNYNNAHDLYVKK